MPDATTTQAPFTNGEYKIRGFRLKMERYKSGKNEGKPKGVFLFHLVDDRFRDEQGRERLVTQTLGWFPGWSVYDINFKLLAGMSRETFKKTCAERAIPAAKQLEFFQSLFKDVEFLAEVRSSEYQGREYLNVWRIIRRLDDGEQPAPERAPARASGPPLGSVEAEINQLVVDLQLNREQLSELCEEEFGVTSPRELDGESRELLRDLLRERKLDDPDPF